MLNRLMQGRIALYSFLGVWVVLLAFFPQAPRCAVIFDRTEAELGTIYRDEPQQIVFEFKNESEDTLYFVDIEPSCDCTTAEVIPGATPPGGKGKVVVFFDPMGYENRGHFTEFVRLTTTDHQTPEVMLTFGGVVEIGPEPEPKSLSFGTVCRGQSDTLSLKIHLPSSKHIAVLDAYSDTACVIVADQGKSDDSTYNFVVIATNTASCGKFAGFLTVVTSDSLRQKIRIPVSASFAGHILAEPDIVAFGPTLPGSYISQKIRIYAIDGRKFDVPMVTSSLDYIQPEISKLQDGTCEVRLKIKDDAPSGRAKGKLTIETTCPDEPPIEVEVTGYVRSTR